MSSFFSGQNGNRNKIIVGSLAALGIAAAAAYFYYNRNSSSTRDKTTTTPDGTIVEVDGIDFHNKIFRKKKISSSTASVAGGGAASSSSQQQQLQLQQQQQNAASSSLAQTNSSYILKVMNFNLLAEVYAHAHIAIAKHGLKFDERVRLNVRHVEAMKPCLLVTEETDPEYLAEFDSIGYECVAKEAKKGKEEEAIAAGKPPPPPEYTCLFFKRGSGLKCLRAEAINVDPTNERKQFAIFAHVEFQPPSSVSSSENKQKERQQNQKPVDFIVIGWHAKAGRNDEAEQFRLDDSANIVNSLLLQFVRTLGGAGPGAAAGNEAKYIHLMNRVLWVGDFNAGPSSYGGKFPCRVIPWLLGDADPLGRLEARNSLKLVSAVHELHGEHADFTTCKWRDEMLVTQTIDHVLMSPELGRCVGSLVSPSANPTEELKPAFLPNLDAPSGKWRWGSDHLSVYVELDLSQNGV